MRSKKWVRLLSVAVAGLLAGLMAGCGSEEGVSDYLYRQISVTGNGIATTEPDVARLIVGVDISMDDPADAVEEAAERANAVMAAAREAGVPGEDMQTTSYNMWVEEVYDPYTYEYTGEVEYHVIHQIRVDVRDMERIGEVLAVLVDAGANSVNSVFFTVDDPTAIYDSAYANAVEDARERAELLAASLGVTLGEATSVSEWGSYYPYADASSAALCNYGGGLGYAESPPLTPGSFTANASVQVTFSIE
jgi:uncharacterized protein YggE